MSNPSAPVPPFQGDSDAFTELVLRYLDGLATPEECATLRKELGSSPDRRSLVISICRLHGSLGENFAAERQKQLLSAAGSEAAGPMPRKSTRRAAMRRRSAPDRSFLVPALVAAVVLAAIALFFVLSPSGSEPEASPRRGREAQSGGSREAEARRQLERDRLERERASAEAQAKRLEGEARLREIEEKRRALAQQAKADPAQGPQDKEQREKDLEALRRDQARIEQELREASELAKKTPRPAPVLPPQEPKSPSPETAPAVPSPGSTQAVLARVEEVAGEAFLVTKEGKSPLAAETNVISGQGLETGGGASRIVLRFVDKTRVDLGPETMLTELKLDSGKQLALSQGNVRAVVAKQPKGEPLIITTPHGQTKVVGTTLRLVVDPDPKKGTKLEVEEGKVELKNLAGKTVMVESGHYAMAALGVELVAKPFPPALDLGGGVRLELITIKPGTFTMGSTEAPKQSWQVDERPEHRVTITKGYSLGKSQVTRGQFAAFVRATGYKTDAEKDGKAGCWIDGTWQEVAGASWQNPKPFKQTDEHPAVCVSWNDANAFCTWATTKTGRLVRLPTEAEWEYACRAGTKTKWWFGENEASMVDYGWIMDSGPQTQPVGQKRPNPWGLYDMYGNAWEWCGDWSGPYVAAGDAVDPTGPAVGSARCLRGGSWHISSLDCHSAVRDASAPSGHDTEIGFRVAVR